jgi:hypothetical protein
VIISRQFVEMTRSRIEGLLAAFPKLMSSGKQHTFVETESVRYVYQPLEKLYVLLITTKASNILEDLETLRLFARVVSIQCSTFKGAFVMATCPFVFVNSFWRGATLGCHYLNCKACLLDIVVWVVSLFGQIRNPFSLINTKFLTKKWLDNCKGFAWTNLK